MLRIRSRLGHQALSFSLQFCWLRDRIPKDALPEQSNVHIRMELFGAIANTWSLWVSWRQFLRRILHIMKEHVTENVAPDLATNDRLICNELLHAEGFVFVPDAQRAI